MTASLLEMLTGQRDDDEENWRAESSCSRVDPDEFFPEYNESTTWQKKVCGRCTVAVPCLGLAIGLEDEGNKAWGVWGGLTATERRALTRGQRLQAIAAARAFQLERDDAMLDAA